MNFVVGLPLSPNNRNAIWVIVDRLTKSAHFLAIRINWSLPKLPKVYIHKIVRLHGVLASIISNEILSDGQLERVIHISEDMLRVCAINFESSWEHYLPLVKFAYNNNFQYSIQMVLYEALYA
ncbi:Transposon Ty3-I Gag-Pol polyprotein [Gossypium australe]|uniref:Transposon Ty3-I Gag-Pol polyprotein n=1 Tax=Gossypium australe TaxID=47621 RepID=A0A5B6VJN8_9ROSI|nr:Transposon Ty3-I Gag-Pol polyprotein [Gossypium australe]